MALYLGLALSFARRALWRDPASRQLRVQAFIVALALLLTGAAIALVTI